MGRQPRATVLHSWLVSLIDLGAMLTVFNSWLDSISEVSTLGQIGLNISIKLHVWTWWGFFPTEPNIPVDVQISQHQDAESCPETASETSGILLSLASYEFRVSDELISFVNLTIFTYLATDCICIAQKYETNLHGAFVRMVSTGDIIQIGLRRRFYSNLCTS